MKKILMIIALAAVTTGFAQKNKEKETIVTKTSVTDNKGTEVATKSVTQTKKEAIDLKASDAGQVNQKMVVKPIETDTQVNYDFDGNRFRFLSQKDKDGYRLMTLKDNATQEEYAIIKPTSQNGYYILSKQGESSFGYFNEKGNFVVERYDPNTDTVVSEVFKLEMNKDSMKK